MLKPGQMTRIIQILTQILNTKNIDSQDPNKKWPKSTKSGPSDLTQILLINFEVKMASAHEVCREQLLLNKVYSLVLL